VGRGSLRRDAGRIGESLSLEDVVDVAGGQPVVFEEPARARVRARALWSSAIAEGRTMYGVTTGFGALADTPIEPSQAAALQRGIVTSHATAVGRPLPREEARAMLLLRATCSPWVTRASGRGRRPHGRDAEPRRDPVRARAGLARRVGDSRRSRASRCR
jgi:hypothetical protein